MNREEYFSTCDTLIQHLSKFKYINQYHDIVAIGRGGLIPAQLIAYYFDIPHIHVIGLRSYNGKKQGDIKMYQPLCPNTNIQHMPVLVVDNLVDTGTSVKYVTRYLNREFCCTFITVCSLFTKTNANPMPDFTGMLIPNNTWISFFYEQE